MELERQFQAKMNQKLRVHIFGLLLLPLVKQRQTLENSLSSFVDMLSIMKPEQGVDEDMSANLRIITRSDLPEEYMANYLQKFGFLKNVPISELIKAVSNEELVVIRCDKNRVLDLANSKSVFLVMDGKIVFREHSINDPTDYHIVQVCRSGDILNVPEFDMGVSNGTQVFPVVQSTQAHLVEMSHKTFQMLFKLTKSLAKELEMSNMNQSRLFAALTEQSKYKIVFGGDLKTRKFNEGLTIVPMHKQSPWNTEAFQVYRDFKPIISANEKNLVVTVSSKLAPPKFKTKATFSEGLDQYIKVKLSEMPREFKFSIKGAMEFLKAETQSQYNRKTTSTLARALTRRVTEAAGINIATEIRTKIPPLYILTQGKAYLKLREENGLKVTVHTLRVGDAFGYSDLLGVKVSCQTLILLGARADWGHRGWSRR